MGDEQIREDELVSAYLDGETTPSEIAEIELNDMLMARAARLRSVRDAVAAPVAPMPAERREQAISAALAAAGDEDSHRRDARTVPVRRRRETLLAVAAAAIGLAAVVSAGLIAGTGGNESAEMAADAPADAAAPADAEAEAVEADTAAPVGAGRALADDGADHETAPEPMPERGPTAEAGAATAEEQPTAETAGSNTELGTALSAAQAAPAMEAPAGQAADAAPVVDLGAFENLESLLDDVAARWAAALENGATADSGTCSAAVRERERELDVEAGRPFVAAVGAEEPLVLDGRSARLADGTAVIVYAAPPDCETGIHEQDEPDGS